MNCPNCNQPIAAGAAFCGNCGQTLAAAPVAAPGVAPQPTLAVPPQPVVAPAEAPIAPVVAAPVTPLPQAPTAVVQSPAPAVSPIAQTFAGPQPPAAPAPITVGGAPLAAAAGGVPAYALATPSQHVGETKALVSLIFGILGIICALFIMPLIGLVLGIISVVLGTMTRHSTKKGMSTAGLIIGSVAIIASFAGAILNGTKAGTASGTTSMSTPCYSLSVQGKMKVNNTSDSCDMEAYNGASLTTSSEFYRVLANKTQLTSDEGFAAIAKSAIDKDVQANLPGFTIDSENVSQFSGSTAYAVNASNSSKKIAVEETAVYHPSPNGNNVFIMVHAISGTTNTDLTSLESKWQWK